MASGAIDAIVTLGFSSAEAEAALLATGSVDEAAGLLLGMDQEARLQLVNSAKKTESSSEGEWEDEDDHEPCKMVLCVRTDLGMSTGKMCSQSAHAAVDLVLTTRKRSKQKTGKDTGIWMQQWLSEGMPKIALACPTLEKLHELSAAAEQLGLPTAIIADAGLTEVRSGTETVLGIGPAPKSIVDQVTGQLKLL